MVILGIDAGLTAPGFAVVQAGCHGFIDRDETDYGFPGKILHLGCFNPTSVKDSSKTLFDVARVGEIVSEIYRLITTYTVTDVVAELPTGGAKSANAIRGMAMSTAMTAAALELILKTQPQLCSIQYITPMQNKAGSTGGRLKKAKTKEEQEDSKWAVMRAVAVSWPSIAWPKKKRKTAEYDGPVCWAMADALSAILTYYRLHGLGSSATS